MNDVHAPNTCPHCNQEFSPAGLPNHRAHCLAEPERRRRIVKTMRSLSEDGYIIRVSDYHDVQKQYSLPGFGTVRRWIGNWDDYAAWCGLEPASERPRAATRERTWFADVPTVMVEELTPDYGLPFIEGWRVIGEWTGRKWEPVRAEQVWLLR